MRRTPLLAAILLAGCTQSPGRYPSLLPRPIEGQSLAEPERPVPVATPDAALDTRIAAITATLDASDKKFVAAAQQAEAKIAVARGLKEGTPGWLDAQAALSTLDALKAPVATALAELEQMEIERGTAGQPPYPALDAAQARAEALSTAQSDRIGALEATLAGA
jgi:hypothetical protein